MSKNMSADEKLALAIAKLRDCAEAFDDAKRRGDDPLSDFDWDNALKEVQQTLRAVEPRTHLVRAIELTRSWDSDLECLYDNNLVFKHCLFTAWTKQVEAEFVDAAESHPAVYNPKVVVLFEKKKIGAIMPSGDLEATFLVALDFEYGNLGQSFTNDCDVIQHIFYEEYGCGGHYTMAAVAPEKEEA